MPFKAILNSLIASLISCLFAVGFKYLGIYLIVLSYFSSLPIFISAFYFGSAGIFLTSICSIFIITSITSFYVGILFFITNILPVTLIIFEKAKNKLSYLNFISKITLINSVFFIIFSFTYKDKIKNITQSITDHLNQNLNSNIIIDQSILDLAPSIMIFSWNIVLIVNLMLSRIILIKFFNKSTNFSDKLIDLKLQKWMITLFIIFLIPASLINNENGVLFRSLTLIYSIPVTIQGLGVMHVFFKNKKISDFFIYTFYSVIFLVPIALPIITAIGVLESVYNFRDLKFKKVNRNID